MELPFENNDAELRREVDRVMEERERLGLSGLVGGLEYVVINTEPDRQRDAVRELLDSTGLAFDMAFEDDALRGCVLRQDGGADFVVTARLQGDNPFLRVNAGPKTAHLPNTRMETLVFSCPRLEEYVDIQTGRGVEFMTPDIVKTDVCSFIQTRPSPYTGNSLGFVKWAEGHRGEFLHSGARALDWTFAKPDLPHLKHVHQLDHMATRVRAEERDKAIVEFMGLTNYTFEFAIYVESLNSITNVARLSGERYAMVFTSGIKPFTSVEESGPTELFIHNHGTRVHHMAFRTERIQEAFAGLKGSGMEFLVELVGSPEEGLRQTFSRPMKNTLLVNEYIERYGDFTGFFTRSNVTLLTEATTRQ